MTTLQSIARISITVLLSGCTVTKVTLNAAAPLAADPSCSAVASAQQRLLTVTGLREYASRYRDAAGQYGETLTGVLTADGFYTNDGKGWKKIDRTVWAAKGALLIRERQYRDCKSLGREVVNGVATTHYELHYAMSAGDVAATGGGQLPKFAVASVWIGDDGLQYRMVVPPFGSMHFEYGEFDTPH